MMHCKSFSSSLVRHRPSALQPNACRAHALNCRRHTCSSHFSSQIPSELPLHPRTALQQRAAGAAQPRRVAVTAAAAVGTPAADVAQQAELHWLTEKGVNASRVQLKESSGNTSRIVAAADVQTEQNVLEISGDLCVTSADVAASDTISAAAANRGELTGLALWLIAERQKGPASPWSALLQSLPQRVNTPLLWSQQQIDELLRGSPVAEAARQRAAEVGAEWKAISSAEGVELPAGVFTEEAFMEAMSVVLAHALYLPAAQCFALVPAMHRLRRSGSQAAASLDYDADSGSVVLKASRSYRPGEEICLYDGRPNGELFMATGTVETNSPSDYLTMQGSLVAADRLYGSKKDVLDAVGFANPQEFPITVNGMPLQLLSYMRMARIQNSAEFAKVTFDQDIIISPANEYEVLQLLLADCRDRMSAYGGSAEDDVKDLQRQDLTVEQRGATQLRLEEKKIVQGTMDAVRLRLAPIRGIPTKQGNLADPNSDLREIFDTLEAIPNVPGKIIDGIKSWARGDQDPTWKKKGKR